MHDLQAKLLGNAIAEAFAGQWMWAGHDAKSVGQRISIRFFLSAFRASSVSRKRASPPRLLCRGESRFLTQLSQQSFSRFAPWPHRVLGRLMHCGVFGSAQAAA